MNKTTVRGIANFLAILIAIWIMVAIVRSCGESPTPPSPVDEAAKPRTEARTTEPEAAQAAARAALPLDSSVAATDAARVRALLVVANTRAQENPGSTDSGEFHAIAISSEIAWRANFFRNPAADEPFTLPPQLVRDPELERQAIVHCQKMAHARRTFHSKAHDATCQENLMLWNISNGTAIDGFFYSITIMPGFDKWRTTISDWRYTRIGAAYCRSGDYCFMCVQVAVDPDSR